MPVAKIPRWTASFQWKALLFGRLVNNQYLDRPSFRLTRTLAKAEVEDEVPVAERGWQEAVESIYPLKINEVIITDADLTYIDESNPTRPLRLRNVNVYASNIRKIHSRDRQYPSEFAFEGILFDSGRIRLNGHVDFLAEPHLGIKADIIM